MTDLRELIHQAADIAPAPDGLLSAVRVAARRRHRRHRRHLAYGSLGTAAALTAAVLGGPRLLPAINGSAAPTGPATASTPSGGPRSASAPVSATPATEVRCDGYRSTRVPAGSIPSAVRLLSNDPAYALNGPGTAGQVQGSCGSAPLALAYEGVTGARVVRTLRLSGPSSPQENVGGSVIAVRGTTGQLVTTAAGLLLTWTEGSASWTLDSSGLSRTQLLAVADGLTLTGTVTADPATTRAAGLEGGPVSPQPPSRDTWDVAYQVDGQVVWLHVETGDVAGRPGTAATVVEINGHRGELADLLISTVVWQPSAGVVAEATVTGLTDQQLVAFADTLRAVPAADPRLG